MNIEFGKNLLMYVLRTLILIIYFFLLTPGYIVFVIFVVFGIHCSVKDSYLHLFSRFVVNFTLWSTLFFAVLLNFFFLRKESTIFYRKVFFE